MGMEIAMARGRFLQFTQTNSRGKQKRGEMQKPQQAPLRSQEQIDLMGEGRMGNVIRWGCLSLNLPGNSGRGL